MRMNRWLREVIGMESEQVKKLDRDEEVLNSGFTLEEIKNDIEKRKKVLERLETEIQNHFEKYKDLVEEAVRREGVEMKKLEAKAKQQKSLGQEKQENYYVLMNQYMTFKRMVTKHEMIKTRKGVQQGGYEVSFDDIDTEGMKDAAEGEKVEKEREQQKRREVEREMDFMSGDVDMDVEDIDKTVEELQKETMPDDEYGVDNSFETSENGSEKDVGFSGEGGGLEGDGGWPDPFDTGVSDDSDGDDNDEGGEDDGSEAGSSTGDGLDGVDDKF